MDGRTERDALFLIGLLVVVALNFASLETLVFAVGLLVLVIDLAVEFFLATKGPLK